MSLRRRFARMDATRFRIRDDLMRNIALAIMSFMRAAWALARLRLRLAITALAALPKRLNYRASDSSPPEAPLH